MSCKTLYAIARGCLDAPRHLLHTSQAQPRLLFQVPSPPAPNPLRIFLICPRRCFAMSSPLQDRSKVSY